MDENNQNFDNNETTGQNNSTANETESESPTRAQPESPSSHQPSAEEASVKRKSSKKKRSRPRHQNIVEEPQPLEVPLSEEYGYPLELGGADILPPEGVDGQQDHNVQNSSALSQLNIGADASISQPSDKVYLQETSGFRRTEREQYEKYVNERQKLDAQLGKDSTLVPTNIEAIQTGIACQNFFRTFALVLQGLIAGFATAHCLLVIFLTPPYFKNIDFVNHYAPLAMPLHCLYYVVLVVCAVAVLDRYDVNQTFFRVIWRALTFQSGGLSVLLYITIVAINAVCLPVEERMTLYLHNSTSLYGPINDPTLQPTEAPDLSYDLQYWRGLLIARAVLSTLGWLLVALRPTTDLLSKHMRNAGDEFSGETAKVNNDVPAVVVSSLTQNPP